jgi:hypothetical protein
VLLSLLTAANGFAEPGDINGDDLVDLKDAILALQIASGETPTATIDPISADVNGDTRIGVPEALFIFKKIRDETFLPIPLQSTITKVQPMTGIVFWADSEHNASTAIQLEFAYVGYDTIAQGENQYDWSSLDSLLAGIASRGHQAIIRFYFVYPGFPTTVPAYIKNSPGYQETHGTSEGLSTWFPDWANQKLKDFVLSFYTALAARYDNDPRLAFLQVGFGLWAEYHIYDGPMILGKTFPDKAFQSTFLSHMGAQFNTLKWNISIDAADTDRSPFAENPALLNLGFGLFDDSFLHKTHHLYNADCFTFFSYQNRYATAPMGGEFSYYTAYDQRMALAPNGPYGTSFEKLAGTYHISYMIGNDQPQYQTMNRIKTAGMATGYRFRITSFETSATTSRGQIENIGITPIYYDAYVAVNGVRSGQSLKGLLPGAAIAFTAASGGDSPTVTIECDRLVTGQTIQYEANLSE